VEDEMIVVSKTQLGLKGPEEFDSERHRPKTISIRAGE
jgi:hypothetical protein